LFKIDIYDLVDLMDNTNKMLLFEKLDQLSLIELVIDYKLDFNLVKNWLQRYMYYRILLKQSNKQLTYRSNTSEQIILYYYLVKIGIINLDEYLQDANKKANLLSFLMNRDKDNIRRDLRNANIRDHEGKYYTKSNLNHILQLAEEVDFKELQDLAKADIKRLHNSNKK
jgi:hypothetical protein